MVVGRRSGVRLFAIAMLALGIVGVGIYRSEASTLRRLVVRGGNKAIHADLTHCQTKVDGKVVQLLLGQGIETAEGWRNCQTYDGHTLIVYSIEPPKPVAVDSGFSLKFSSSGS